MLTRNTCECAVLELDDVCSCIMSLDRGRIVFKGSTLPTIVIVLVLNASTIMSGHFVFLLRTLLSTSTYFPLFGMMRTSIILAYDLIFRMRQGVGWYK